MNTLVTILRLLINLYNLFVKRELPTRKRAVEKRRRRANLGLLLTAALVRLIVLGGSLLSLLFVDPVFAQTPEPSDDEVNAIAKQLYCPVCENIPLDVCPTQACAQWRETIREKLAAGWGEQQIKDYFVQQYGERVLAQPSTRGLNILVWVLPPIGLLLGVFFLVQYLRRAKRPAPGTGESPTRPDDDYAKQLERELEKRR